MKTEIEQLVKHFEWLVVTHNKGNRGINHSSEKMWFKGLLEGYSQIIRELNQVLENEKNNY